MSHTASAPALKGTGQMSLKERPRGPRSTPKWPEPQRLQAACSLGPRLEHELMQERYCEQAMEDWRKDVQSRLGQIRQKPRLRLGF